MKETGAAFLAGALFGLGLAVSEMIDPARVVGFLNVTGSWDPTLLLVMAGALGVAGLGFPLILRRQRPILAAGFSLPTRTKIDSRLVAGAAVFGVGWGLAGFCPGPALAALASLSPSVFAFVLAMIVGQWVATFLERATE